MHEHDIGRGTLYQRLSGNSCTIDRVYNTGVVSLGSLKNTKFRFIFAAASATSLHPFLGPCCRRPSCCLRIARLDREAIHPSLETHMSSASNRSRVAIDIVCLRFKVLNRRWSTPWSEANHTQQSQTAFLVTNSGQATSCLSSSERRAPSTRSEWSTFG
jgi:hypothetical protein